jgi:hypothetical protein
MVDSVVGPDEYHFEVNKRLPTLSGKQQQVMQASIETLAKIGQLKRF